MDAFSDLSGTPEQKTNASSASLDAGGEMFASPLSASLFFIEVEIPWVKERTAR